MSRALAVRISVYQKGYRNRQQLAVMKTEPYATWSIADVYAYITDYTRAGRATEQLRLLTDKTMRRDYKMLNFEVATFSGTFSYRNAQSIVCESDLMVVDIDDLASLEDAERLKERLCHDEHYVTVLCFISPSGNGVKWVIERQPNESETFRQEFDRVYNYVGFEYGIPIDTACSDICRACFLPYDKTCFINPKYK